MSFKRLDGRDEAIIDPAIPIIDAHHHLFDRPGHRYMLDEYADDAGAGHRIVASVYVETLAFADLTGLEAMRPLGEVEFANGMAAMAAAGSYGQCRVAAAIVGFADLRLGDAIGPYLDAALRLAPNRFRGVRQVTIEHSSETPFRYMTHRPPVAAMTHPSFRDGLVAIAERGLSFDAAVFHNQLPELARIADACPDLPIILNHLGLAMAMEMDETRRQQVFEEWRAGLDELALRPNVNCKIGGLGMPFWGFGFDEVEVQASSEELARVWRPYVEAAVETFGPTRCMMESNYPPDSRSCGFVPLWNALKLCAQGFSPDEKAALFHDTAARVYRIVPPG
jgi:predicted TIM-barrel fold metal-dependent hydrolase